MSNELQNLCVQKFVNFYEKDIEAEQIDSNNVVLSFPVHFSGFHRAEITVTRTGQDHFIISDGAKTLEELRVAGYALTKRLKERLETISKAAKLRVINNYLISESDLENLGSSIQRFLEAAKTIGDAYLVQRMTLTRDTELIDKVSSFLKEQQVPYRSKYELAGQYERHVIDFYFPPNGVPGLALSVMNNPRRTLAEAWAFRSLDIKHANQDTRVGIVYDDDGVREESRSILDGILDVSIPSSDIASLGVNLRSLGLLNRAQH